MRKTVTILFFSIAMVYSFQLSAQEKMQGIELGVRLGAFSGGGAAVDATFPLSKNRIHADLGFYSSGVGVAAFFDWSFPIEAGFSFYPGVGAEMGIGDPFVIGVGGELGFEYAFKIPLTIGLDWRPTFIFGGETGFGYSSFGLNIRYRF